MSPESVPEFNSPDLSIATVLCDRHDADLVAFTFIDANDFTPRHLTFGELGERSMRLATALRGRGVRSGDRVPVLMGKRPELIVAMMALWRLGAVHVPLFTAFAKGAIEMRVESSHARVVITETSQRHKLIGIDVQVIDADVEFDALIRTSAPMGEPVAIGAQGTFVQIYTSGTTGKPKGVAVPGRALAAFRSYMHLGLDVRAEDTFWNAADPGWAYGLYYGLIGPLAIGHANILFTGGFSAESTAKVLKEQMVSNFAGAPTIYRALSRMAPTSLPTLRRASSAGEPLTPDIPGWSRGALGIEVRDHYGQTELGMAIANGWHPEVFAPVRGGSMGRALPGFTVTTHDGQIALDVERSPLLWFSGYVEDERKSAARFVCNGTLYLTGDTGRVDGDGYWYFSSRDDDVILAAGYRIGPFEIESVLSTHGAVAEVAVVGRPDPEGLRGEIVEAYVVLAPQSEPSQDLVRELQDVVRNDYSRHAYPRAIHFVTALPKTPSGKVQRYVLRDGRAS